ncbi:MAG: hypothetical protein ACYC9O_04885 [Candidatus Latescibacterota bacterium]
MRKVMLTLVMFIMLAPGAYSQQQKMIKILVTSPQISDKVYRPVADVFAGSVIRELNRKGGLVIVDREQSEAYLRKKGLPEWAVDNRELAIEVGKALGADIVIYSTLSRNLGSFVYSLGFLEVDRDVIQRILNGSFSETASPGEIGKFINEEVRKLVNYIPLPSELGDRGLAFREETVNPDNLPRSAEIELPRMDRFGAVEQVLSYYRVFPGEMEYVKLDIDQQITRVQLEEGDIDGDLMRTFSRMQMYGEYALRYNMQSYLIKNCSVRALNVLLANKIPVFWTDDGMNVNLLTGYTGLRQDGVSIFRTFTNDEFDSFYLTHRKLIAILVILPKPGKKGGISREYLETAISRYHNDWGKTPELVEIKEGFLDIISSGLGEY